MSFFRDNFWGERNSGFDVLYHNMKHGQISTKELAEFVRERAAIEENYSKSMSKLSKMASGSSQLGTFAPMWDIFRISSDKLALCHLELARKLNDLIRDISKYGDEQVKVHRKTKEEVTGTLEVVQMMQVASGQLHKAKECYYNRCLEQERLRKEAAAQKDVEKADNKARKAAESFSSSVEKFNRVGEEFERKMNESAQKFQNIEECHLRQMKVLIKSYSHSIENTHVQIGQVHEEFKQNVENTGTDTLVRRFAEQKGTGRERPGTVGFEDFNSVAFLDGIKKNRNKTFRIPGLNRKEKEPESQDYLTSDIPNSPEVDEEGFIIRSDVNQNDILPECKETNFYSSDSDFDDDEPKKIRIQIRPVASRSGQDSAATEQELKATVGALTLPPNRGVSIKRQLSRTSGSMMGNRSREEGENAQQGDSEHDWLQRSTSSPEGNRLISDRPPPDPLFGPPLDSAFKPSSLGGSMPPTSSSNSSSPENVEDSGLDSPSHQPLGPSPEPSPWAAWPPTSSRQSKGFSVSTDPFLVAFSEPSSSSSPALSEDANRAWCPSSQSPRGPSDNSSSSLATFSRPSSSESEVPPWPGQPRGSRTPDSTDSFLAVFSKERASSEPLNPAPAHRKGPTHSSAGASPVSHLDPFSMSFSCLADGKMAMPPPTSSGIEHCGPSSKTVSPEDPFAITMVGSPTHQSSLTNPKQNVSKRLSTPGTRPGKKELVRWNSLHNPFLDATGAWETGRQQETPLNELDSGRKHQSSERLDSSQLWETRRHCPSESYGTEKKPDSSQGWSSEKKPLPSDRPEPSGGSGTEKNLHTIHRLEALDRRSSEKKSKAFDRRASLGEWGMEMKLQSFDRPDTFEEWGPEKKLQPSEKPETISGWDTVKNSKPSDRLDKSGSSGTDKKSQPCERVESSGGWRIEKKAPLSDHLDSSELWGSEKKPSTSYRLEASVGWPTEKKPQPNDRVQSSVLWGSAEKKKQCSEWLDSTGKLGADKKPQPPDSLELSGGLRTEKRQLTSDRVESSGGWGKEKKSPFSDRLELSSGVGAEKKQQSSDRLESSREWGTENKLLSSDKLESSGRREKERRQRSSDRLNSSGGGEMDRRQRSSDRCSTSRSWEIERRQRSSDRLGASGDLEPSLRPRSSERLPASGGRDNERQQQSSERRNTAGSGETDRRPRGTDRRATSERKPRSSDRLSSLGSWKIERKQQGPEKHDPHVGRGMETKLQDSEVQDHSGSCEVDRKSRSSEGQDPPGSSEMDRMVRSSEGICGSQLQNSTSSGSSNREGEAGGRKVASQPIQPAGSPHSNKGDGVDAGVTPPPRPSRSRRSRGGKLSGCERSRSLCSSPLLGPSSPLTTSASSSSSCDWAVITSNQQPGSPSTGVSRGPSPVTLGNQEAWPVAAAITEYINAYFKGGEHNCCLVKITGDLTLSFPSGIVQIFSNSATAPVLSFRLVKTARVDQFVPNQKLLFSDPSQTDPDSRDFWVNMQALTVHLQREAELNPQASYYNVGLLKYQVSSQDPRCAPLRLSAQCMRSGSVTRVSLDYHYCPSSSSTELSNVQVVIPLEESAMDVQCQPAGVWNAEERRLLWKLPNISLTTDGKGKVRASWQCRDGHCGPPPNVGVQFVGSGDALSGVDLELVGGRYRMSLVKKRFATGKYMAGCSV
ncbi:F-BAR domain only protein 1 [Erpetoichthys calabaricus]|uniref:F-BAR domain only protein 1 n=1 Tax=Erpetoichthys calabaricus TaxID=27687 RepID=UPI002233FDDA|nr:F-BAR domain only protein 1 [Erpetoichthys calabaricus]